MNDWWLIEWMNEWMNEWMRKRKKWKAKVMQNFGGQIRWIMGNVEVAYMKIGGKNLKFHFVKYRKTSSAMQKYCWRGFKHHLTLMDRCDEVEGKTRSRGTNWFLKSVEGLRFAYTANIRFKLRISQNRKWADKNSSKQFFWIKHCLKLRI